MAIESEGAQKKSQSKKKIPVYIFYYKTQNPALNKIIDLYQIYYTEVKGHLIPNTRKNIVILYYISKYAHQLLQQQLQQQLLHQQCI